MSRDISLTDGSGILDALVANPLLALAGLMGVFLLASIGAIVGMITRKMVILAGLLLIPALIFIFHERLPLPADIHRQLDGAHERIGL